MSVEVKARWHKLTSPDRREVYINEAAIAFARPYVKDGITFHEIGFIGGAIVTINEDPGDFLGEPPSSYPRADARKRSGG